MYIMGIFKKYLLIVLILVSPFVFIITGCDSGGEEESSSPPPPAVSLPNILINAVSSTQNNIILSWVDPSEDGLDYVEISYNDGSGSETQNINAGIQNIDISGLSESTEHAFSIRCAYEAGQLSDILVCYISTTSSGFLEYLLINTVEDLHAVRGGVAGYDDWGLDKHYLLMADLDLTDYDPNDDESGWVPLGEDTDSSTISDFEGTPFTGSFNGNGHVNNGLTIDRDSISFQGLFGYIDSAGSVKNLVIANTDITGYRYTGGLAGYNSGSVSAVRWGYQSNYIGGLAGNCLGIVSNCYAMGAVSSDFGYGTGGLVGRLNNGTVVNCYATGIIDGQYDNEGLVGDYNSGTITTSFFYQLPDNSSGTFSTESAMKQETTYINAGWDFVDETSNGNDDIWDIGNGINNGFPYLVD